MKKIIIFLVCLLSLIGCDKVGSSKEPIQKDLTVLKLDLNQLDLPD